MLRDFVDRSAQGFTVQDSDKQLIIDFYKYALVGMALEWIRKDMKEDPVRMTERLNVLLHGELERALRRFRTARSPADLDDRQYFINPGTVMGFPSRCFFCIWPSH